MKRALGLLGLTCAAFLVLGYHPGVEDDTTYLAAVKHVLDPSLYPRDAEIVTSQAQLTVFPWAMAAFVRASGLPLAVSELLWQFLGLFGLLAGCFLVAAECFPSGQHAGSARWAGTAFVAVMLAMPVAKTQLFLADQHLHPRLLATDCVLFAVAAILRGRGGAAWPLLALGAALHPLMTAFGASFCTVLSLQGRRWVAGRCAFAGFWLWEKPGAGWAQATRPRTFLFVWKWPWYAWGAILGPLALAAWLRAGARRRGERTLERVCGALLVYGGVQLCVAMAVLAPGAPAWLVQFEPMRFLYLVYLLTCLLGAGAFGRWWLRGSSDRRTAWRWVLVFAPLAGGMWVDQATEFAGSPHVEWPGAAPAYPWLAAFAWVRANTPVDAYFALNPRYTELPGEGVHSFRALAERSALMDWVKDRDVVAHVPHLGERWVRETGAAAGWGRFGAADFKRLGATTGVDWVVVERAVPGLRCPYARGGVWVCRIGNGSEMGNAE